jgi:uncharacterized protein YbcI
MSTASGEPIRPGTQISNALARIHREAYGRGATTVRTVISRDYVVTFMHDLYTPAERTLIDGGRREEVRMARSAFQDVAGPRFRQAVEDALGRNVLAFLSQNHFDPDLAVEAFVLEPEDGRAAEV